MWLVKLTLLALGHSKCLTRTLINVEEWSLVSGSCKSTMHVWELHCHWPPYGEGRRHGQQKKPPRRWYWWLCCWRRTNSPRPVCHNVQISHASLNIMASSPAAPSALSSSLSCYFLVLGLWSLFHLLSNSFSTANLMQVLHRRIKYISKSKVKIVVFVDRLHLYYNSKG